MNLLLLIVVFCLLGGLLSVLAAASFLGLPAAFRERVIPHLVSFATGALLGAAFIGLLPEAMEMLEGDHVEYLTATVLLGLLAFFVLEKMVIWRHCHNEHCAGHSHGSARQRARSAGTLILVGDAIHNFVDGVLIGAAFLTDPAVGVVTSIAVAAHEIPQELGDFAILLASGYSRGRAFAWNMAASLTTVLGGLLAWLSLSQSSTALPYLIAVAAASFIYIAVADLIPGMHERTAVRESLQQIVLITLGVVVIAGTEVLLH
jgi:zinc and cadmium transporter